MNRTNPVRNEEGFVLVAAMMVLLILVVLGISATSTSMLEVQIAGNERVGKTTFYEADGGTEVSSELLEQNWCGGGLGFSTSDIDGNIVVNQTATGAYDFWAAVGTSDPEYPEYHELPSLPADPDPADASDPGVRAFFWPTGYDADGGNLPHTNVTLAGRPVVGLGGALQQMAGYEGKGKGAAQSAAALDYNIFVHRYGTNNSESLLLFQWRHVVGTEVSTCKW